VEEAAQEVQTAIADCKALGADAADLKAEFAKALLVFHAGWLNGLKMIGKAVLIDHTDIVQHIQSMVSD